MHLMTSTSNAALTIFSNNRQRAFNLIAIECNNSNINCLSFNRNEIECSMSDITFNHQCIWWHRHQMQLWQFFQTIVSVHLILSRSNVTIRTSTVFHLIAMKLSAACLTLHSIISAFDDIDIKCSIFDIKINNLSAHNSITASHSFDHFFTSSRTVDQLLYCGGARPLDGKIKRKNPSCKINSIHHSFKNQSSISLRSLTYEINEINKN